MSQGFTFKGLFYALPYWVRWSLAILLGAALVKCLNERVFEV
jgi:hypothetical protein